MQPPLVPSCPADVPRQHAPSRRSPAAGPVHEDALDHVEEEIRRLVVLLRHRLLKEDITCAIKLLDEDGLNYLDKENQISKGNFLGCKDLYHMK
jgi:hypothetical protein